MFGAKKFGATKWGITGAFVGGIIGLFIGAIYGVIIGPFIGAILFELLGGNKLNQSIKIGFGTVIGFLGGTIGRVMISTVMVGIFLFKVFTS